MGSFCSSGLLSPAPSSSPHWLFTMPQHLSYLTLFLLTVAVYFMWMDVALYVNVQQVPPMASEAQPIRANISDYSYSPFYPITIKLLMQGKSSWLARLQYVR